MINNEELPIGFTMEMAMNSNILNYFANLPKDQQDRIVDGARQINSKSEMQQYVQSISKV